MKNLQKISRENLKSIQGGAPYNGGLGGLQCQVTQILCLVGCTPTCVSVSQCHRSYCIDIY